MGSEINFDDLQQERQLQRSLMNEKRRKVKPLIPLLRTYYAAARLFSLEIPAAAGFAIPVGDTLPYQLRNFSVPGRVMLWDCLKAVMVKGNQFSSVEV